MRGNLPNSKRHEILIKWVKKCINNELSSSSTGTVSSLSVKYLFYDGFDITDGKFISINEEDVF